MEKEKQKIKASFLVGMAILVPMWLVHSLIWVLGLNFGNVYHFGILPREPWGLLGIFTSPFLHGDWGHLLSNSGPILLLTAGIYYFYKEIALKTFAWVLVVTGFWVWLIAQPGSSHIGGSGLVYGFAAFLFFSGVFRRDTASIALALVIAFFYGGMVWGIFPGKEGVSWESHLFGSIAGTLFAWHFRRKAVRPRKHYTWQDEPDGVFPGEENAYWNYNPNPPLPPSMDYQTDKGTED